MTDSQALHDPIAIRRDANQVRTDFDGGMSVIASLRKLVDRYAPELQVPSWYLGDVCAAAFAIPEPLTFILGGWSSDGEGEVSDQAAERALVAGIVGSSRDETLIRQTTASRFKVYAKAEARELVYEIVSLPGESLVVEVHSLSLDDSVLTASYRPWVPIEAAAVLRLVREVLLKGFLHDRFRSTERLVVVDAKYGDCAQGRC